MDFYSNHREDEREWTEFGEKMALAASGVPVCTCIPSVSVICDHCRAEQSVLMAALAEQHEEMKTIIAEQQEAMIQEEEEAIDRADAIRRNIERHEEEEEQIASLFKSIVEEGGIFSHICNPNTMPDYLEFHVKQSFKGEWSCQCDQYLEFTWNSFWPGFEENVLKIASSYLYEPTVPACFKKKVTAKSLLLHISKEKRWERYPTGGILFQKVMEMLYKWKDEKEVIDLIHKDSLERELEEYCDHASEREEFYFINDSEPTEVWIAKIREAVPKYFKADHQRWYRFTEYLNSDAFEETVEEAWNTKYHEIMNTVIVKAFTDDKFQTIGRSEKTWAKITDAVSNKVEHMKPIHFRTIENKMNQLLHREWPHFEKALKMLVEEFYFSTALDEQYLFNCIDYVRPRLGHNSMSNENERIIKCHLDDLKHYGGSFEPPLCLKYKELHERINGDNSANMMDLM